MCLFFHYLKKVHMNDFPYYVTIFKSVKYYSMFVVLVRMCQTWIHMSSQCVDFSVHHFWSTLALAGLLLLLCIFINVTF